MTLIDDKYAILGGSGGFLGNPTDIERQTPNGLGTYRHYDHGSIYWHSAFPFEAFVVYGLIRQRWEQMGWERSPVGFPVSDEVDVGSGGGRWNLFDFGAIVYHPAIGTFDVYGAIFRRWRALGGVVDLGFPLTGESGTPDGRGRYNHFQNGSIYYTPQTSAREVRTDVKDVWAASGWEQGPLGYPIAFPSRMPGVFTDFQDFERGSVYTFGASNSHTVTRVNSVFATNETFIAWSDLGRTLPDGDIISPTFAQNFPQSGVHLTLNVLGPVTGWKAVSLFVPGRGDIQEISVDGGHPTATMTIDPSAFDGQSAYLHFKKAKFFGVHTGVYLLPRADRLIGTHLTLNWLKD
jgi:hypothetical protein